jgi:metal-sulfur cluster biosynthetic enzyme
VASDQDIKDALYDVIDPELNMNIVDLGLVYRTQVVDGNVAEVDFTLTYPGCPLGDVISSDIVSQIKKQTDVADVRAQLVWSPAWDQNMMSENARLLMGLSHLEEWNDELKNRESESRFAGSGNPAGYIPRSAGTGRFTL